MNFSPNMIFLNRSFDKKRLKALLLWFRLNLSEGAALEAVEILQGLGFRSATQGAISLGLDDLKTPTSKGGRVFQAQLEVALAHHEHHRGNRTPVELFQHLVDTWHRTSQDLTAEVVQLFHSTERVNPVYMMAFSGARGNLSQVRQLVGMRGLMADPRGQIVGFPILSNFREGLTITEYFVSCYGARKGVVDTAIRTADAGYLTRRLADVSHHFVVRTTNCGTHRNICLRDIKEGQKTILPLASRLVGRVLGEDISFTSPSFTKGDALKSKILKKEGDLNKIEDFNQIAYRNQEITPDLASKLASQCLEVAVRSPLSCSLRWGVCQLCYGWGLSEGRRVTLGEAVGIIAAQSIGEPGTQLTLRTFHTGGVFSGDLLNEIRAPYGGTVFFPEPLQGLLIRTPHGQIAFLTKVSGKMVLFNASQMQRTTTGDLVKKVGEVDPKNKSLSFRTNHSLDVDLKYKEDYNQDQELKKEDNSFYNINKADSPSVKASLLAVQKYSEEKDSPNYNEKKASSQEKNQLKADTKHAFSLQSNTETKEFPLQPSTVIFVRQKEQVNHNQLLAEFSSSTLQPINDQIEVTQQVLSETAGQVWFKEIQYGNRKGPGSGSLGTHFSSQKLGGIWVLAGKPRSEILLNDRQRFPIRFDKNSTNSIKIFDFKSDLKKRKQKHDRCLSPKVIQNFFLNNFEDRRSNASFPIEDWNKMQNQSSLQQKRLKSYKISEINLYHDHYFLTYHYSLGYSQLLNFASNKENKITSIYFKDRKASQQSTNCAPINTSWNIQIGSGWRPRLILNKQKRGIFEKKKNIFLLPPSTSICCDKLALSPHRLIGTSKKLIRFLQPPVISTKSIAFLKFPRSYTWLPNSTLKTEKTKHQVIKVSCKSILWRSNSLEEIYGWRTHRYRSNLIESIFVNNDQITKEKMESPLVNDMPFFIAFGERNGIKSKILREKETTDKVHLLLGTHFKNGIKSDVIKDYNQIPVAWWLQKEWKTAPGMLLVESLFSNKKKTEGQFFWLSSNFIQQNESGGEINNQLRKSISFPNGITFGECEVDVINDYKQNYLPLYSIFDNPQSKEADQAKKIAFNVTKYCASKIFTGVGNKENCNQFQIEDFNENDGIKFIQKKGINAVVTPTGSRGKGSENVLILHHSLDFLFETRKSQNVPVIKKLIQTLNLNRRQYSATNRGIFSPVKQNYTFERFIASIDSKVSQFFSTSNAGDSSIERVKKTKNLLTFKSFWQPLSLNNYPNKISNKRDLQRRKDIQSKLCIKKCNTFVERSSTLSGNKKLRFVNNFIKRKGTKKTVLAQKPIWLSVHISNNNLSFINSVDHPCLVNGVDTARKSKIFSTSLINSTQRELKSKILNEKNDSNLDQHVVHTINLPIVSFPYIIPSRCEWFPKDFKKPYYFSRCGTPVQGKLLPLIRQSFWEEDFFNQTQKDSALGINEVDFILGVLGLDKQKKPGAISKSEFMEILKSSSNSRVNLLTLSNFLQLPNVIQNKLDINRVNNQNVDDQKIPTNLSKVNRIILERLNHLETLNKRKFIALNFPLKSSILNPHNLISLEARDKTHNLIKRLTAYLFNGVKHPKNFTLFTFISFSAVDKLNQFFVRVSDIHFIVSLPIKTITNPQGRYTFAHLKLPKDNVVVTSCVDKKYKLSTIPQKLWTGKIQHIKEILRDQKIFEKKSNLLLKSSILNQDNPQSCYYRLMQRVLEYPVERSSFNRWVTTKRKKLQYSPFSTNFVTLFETEKDVKHGARNTLPIRNKIWITSKKFTSFHSAIYLDWYAFPLRPYDFLPIFGSLYKALSTKNKPINSSIFSKSRPMLINEGERQISLKKATSFLTPLTRAMPYLGESDQITFATNDSSLLSSYQENITHVSTMQRVTVWQSSLLLNKEYFSRFFEFSKRMATSLRWHSLKSKIVIRRHQVNEGDSKISQSVPNSPRNSHLMTFGESNSKTVFPFFILPNEVTMKQKPYSSIYTQLTKSCKLTYLLDFLFAWKRRSLFKANRNRKQKTDRSPLFFASPMHTEGNVKVVDQNLLNNGRAIFNAITFTQLRWLLILTELRKRFGNLNEEETFFDYQGLLGYGNVNKVVESPSFTVGDVTFKDKEKNVKTKPSYLFPGQLVAYGEKIDQNIATTESGQILYVDSQRAILRKAQTVLIYSQAILSVLSGEWIKKGTPLMALSYQKLVTGDIVQGLPKIEQFFEAPLLRDGTFWSDSLQAKLNLFFQEHREKLPLAEAVRKGFSDIQRVLVEGVQRVYISQGVLIADKHLEVIVRQMTCKGRILYSGDTGFLRNELVALDKIESVNQVTYGQKALYHPQVRGITDASLESESFLSAASFQETTRVLSRDSVIGKTDLMRGLKERVIVGELIQAGTGLANNSVYNFLLD